MKTIWNKLPAWIKAAILSVVITIPVVTIIQLIIISNLKSNPGWGWALLVAIPILIVFWKLAQRFTSFSKPEDVKIKMNLNWSDKKVWFRIIGLTFATITTLELSSIIFGVTSEKQNAFLQAFKQFDEITALPLLLAMALTAGVVEEVVYRGFIQNVLVRAYPKTRAFVIIGLLFAISHFLPTALIIPYVLVSIYFSLVANEFKSLGVVIIAHALADVLFLFYGYYVEFATFENGALLPLALGFIVSMFLLFYGNSSIQTIRKKKLSLQQ